MPTPLSKSDLASQAHFLHVAARRLTDAVGSLAFDGATGPDAEAARAAFEGTVQDLRIMCVEALGTPGATNGSIASLIVALDYRGGENAIAAGLRPSSPLLTAMRRVDVVDAGLVSAAHERGAAVLAFDRQPAEYQAGFRSSAEV